MMETIRKSLILTAVCLVSSSLSQEPQPPIYRLPDTISPLNYVLRLELNMDTNTVGGAVMIELQTTNNQSKTLNSITLHMGTDMSVNEEKAVLLDYSGVTTEIGSIQYDDPNSLIKVVLPEGEFLKHDHRYLISLQFTSQLYSEPRALFVGSFNSTSKYVASSFRPTYARDVFPCFDEPQFKVPLTLQVLRPTTHKAVSTAVLSDSRAVPNVSDMMLDTFESTGAISIHSLGLFISEVDPVTTMGLTLYAPPGSPATVPYLQTLLTDIQSSFGPFPVSPLKLVVLPDRLFTSFASYGFVFTSPLVYSGEVPSTLQGQMLRLQLTEAFLRQFLEYAKTPQWWSDLWLSESIAAHIATTLQPEEWFKDWLKTVIRSDALGADFINSGPVVDSQLLSRWDIASVIASQTVRNKGLSILTMWADTMPQGLIDKTILDFINLKKLVVTTEDFLNLMAVNIKANTTYDVTPTVDMLPFWLNTTGHPVVSYVPVSTYEFSLTQNLEANSSSAPAWPISVSFAQNSSRDWDHLRFGEWLLNKTANFTANASLNQWIILNLESAPYRLDYSSWDDVVVALQSDLRTSPLPPDTVRAMLQDDAVALSLSGRLPFSTSLRVLASAQRGQADWYPVTKAFDVFTAKVGDDQNTYTQFKMFAATLFSAELLSDLDLRNSSSHSDLQYLRALVTPWLCRFNFGNCRQAVVELYQQLVQGNISMMDANDVENIACYGVRYSTSAVSDVITAYVETSDLWLRQLFTIGLGCVADLDSVQTVLNATLNKTDIADGDKTTILLGLASSVENSAVMVDFVVDEAYNLQTMLGVGSFAAVIKALGKSTVDLSKLQVLYNHSLDLDPYVIQAAAETVVMAVENWAWWEEYSLALQAALPQLPSTSSTPGTTPNSTNGTTFSPAIYSTPTPIPSSARSFIDIQFFTIVVALVVFSINL